MRKHIIYLVCNSADIAIFTSHHKDLAFDYFRKNCNPAEHYIRECYS